jgi:crotonobetaine/carnitine-CoA ligase
VPTSPLSTADEVGYVIEHSDCKVSITRPDLRTAVAGAQSSDRILEPPILFRSDDSESRYSGKERAGPLDVASVMYTSGTTSRPKGVLVTHANYLYAGEVVAQHLRLRPEDRWLIVLPLFHANAQYYSTMSALVTGASVAVIERFSASRWGAQAARHGATVASLFAAPIRMILAHPETSEDQGNPLRAVIFSQNVTEDQLAEFERRFGAPLLQLYGMTETIAPPTLNPLFGERRNMSIGRPTLPARLRVTRRDGSDVAPGETGMLLVHGEPGRTLMVGYLEDEAATANAIRDGWLHTGDNVREDADGYFHFIDRSKDMIKRAGENVSAGEIEAVLDSHPGVFESAAIGVPDPVRDEAVKVFVVRAPGESPTEPELLDWCRERLARFKVPEAVEFVDELPKTAVGKIQKERLRRRERRSGARP